MAPNSTQEMEIPDEESLEKLVAPQASKNWNIEYHYLNIICWVYINIAGAYGLYLALTEAKWMTIVFIIIYYCVAFMGVTAGAHRLWSHRAYKAKTPLQIILMLCHSATVQISVIWWVETHRMHHKYSDTDADPHNSTRGYFYSHIGWMLIKRHPEVSKRRKFIDASEVKQNPVLVFQKRYIVPLVTTMSLIVPTLIPLLWNETISIAWYINILRINITHNSIGGINSLSHLWGNKPYDKKIAAAQNLFVSFFAVGEGFHNYHHVFPWDYRAAELGNIGLNLTTLFIDMFAKIGWAYDLKTVPEDIVKTRAARTGDQTDSWGARIQVETNRD